MLDGQTLVTKEDLAKFEQKLDLLDLHLKMILEQAKMPEVIKISDIAQIENMSYSQISGKERYLLPRFGISAFPEGTIRWTMKEFLEWKAIPPEKRKQMWWDLPARERQRIVNYNQEKKQEKKAS